MKFFLLWNLSLAILLGFADQRLQLFGMIIIGLAAWPAWYVLAKGIADAAVERFMNRLNARQYAAKDADPSQTTAADPPPANAGLD